MSLRVTQRSISSTALSNLQDGLARLQRLQDQLSSGRQINRPSDSPTGTVSALRIRSDLRRGEQLVRNADDGLGWLGTADTTLMQTLDVMARVRELTLTGRSTGAMDDNSRSALATEMEGLRDHLIGLANAKYLDRPIFAGTASSATAYDAMGAYLGNSGVVSRTVLDGVAVDVNITGPEVFGPPGNDVFQLLSDIASHLRTDPDALSGDISAIDERLGGIKTALAQVGARYHQVETMRDRMAGLQIDSTTALAEVESIDVPKTITELKMQEMAYNAALAATARVIQPSLLDFLR